MAVHLKMKPSVSVPNEDIYEQRTLGFFLRDYFGIGTVPKNMESKEVWPTN